MYYCKSQLSHLWVNYHFNLCHSFPSALLPLFFPPITYWYCDIEGTVRKMLWNSNDSILFYLVAASYKHFCLLSSKSNLLDKGKGETCGFISPYSQLNKEFKTVFRISLYPCRQKQLKLPSPPNKYFLSLHVALEMKLSVLGESIHGPWCPVITGSFR